MVSIVFTINLLGAAVVLSMLFSGNLSYSDPAFWPITLESKRQVSML